MTKCVSLSQFVNTWECDENDHMNVQFYFSKFDDAHQLFSARFGLADMLGTRISRLVRYHSEMRSGEHLQVLSSLVLHDDTEHKPERGSYVQHVMIDIQSGRLTATALDWYEGIPNSAAAEIFDALDARVVGRSFKGALDFERHPAPAFDDLSTGPVSGGVLRSALCDRHGVALDQAYVGAVSDAASHAWDKTGLTSQWLNDNGFGRIAVEMRLFLHEPMMQGTRYGIFVSFHDLHSRSFTKRYDFYDLETGTHYGYLQVAAMILNHTTRRSEPLPDFAKEIISGKL